MTKDKHPEPPKRIIEHRVATLHQSGHHEIERPDHSRIVRNDHGRSFAQSRPYSYRGREYARRTYYDHGRRYERFYGRHLYHDVYVNYYTPAAYYRPAFYSWAYYPWSAPAPYTWAWTSNPWYGVYGGSYFAPYPVYSSASLWLTDYLISTSLAAAYQSQSALAAGAVGLTPDVKSLISAEVQRQVALEQVEAQGSQTGSAPDPSVSSVQQLLTDGVRHVFVVGENIAVLNGSGAQCTVSQGDALQLTAPPPPDSPTATLIVLSTKGGSECAKADLISVKIEDLQEMQNHMRETIDAGLGDMQNKKGPISAPPAVSDGQIVKASFVSAAPPPDPNALKEIEAPTPQTEVASGPTEAPSVNLSLGMTPEEVQASLGKPLTVASTNTKSIYVYKTIKVTFKDGKVTDFQ